MTLGQAVIAAARTVHSIPEADDRSCYRIAAALKLAPSTAYGWDRGNYDPPARLAAHLAAMHGLHVTLTPAGYGPAPQETTPC